MVFLFFCVFEFFSNEHRMSFIILKTCFLETKTQCESAMTRLPGKLVPSLATLEKHTQDQRDGLQCLALVRLCLDQRFV